MVYNVLRKISFVILGVALLNLFAYAVVYVHEGGENLGFLTHPLKEFSEFPKVIFEVAQEVEKPEYSIVADSNFLSENKMSYDLYGMNGRVEKGNQGSRSRREIAPRFTGNQIAAVPRGMAAIFYLAF